MHMFQMHYGRGCALHSPSNGHHMLILPMPPLGLPYLSSSVRTTRHQTMARSTPVQAGFKEGVVSTSNSLDYTKECMEHMKEHDAAIKEMEAAAVAEACRMYEVPFAAVKSVTDIVDGQHATEVEFVQNLGKSVDRLKDAVFELLTAIDGKMLDEL